jgi:iron complex transport system ATP-binding protein
VSILHRLADEQGKCIIFSTHDLNTALSMADRIWLMLNDRVVEGIPEEIASEGYFESLFASNPHLFFDAEKGDFRVRKDSRGIVMLHATGKEQFYATKALERLGFEVVISSALSDFRIPQHTKPATISVFYTEDGWSINHGDQITIPGTLELLCWEIRKINPPRQS